MKYVSIVLVAVVCGAAETKEEAADRESLQGSWSMVSGVAAGMKVDDELRMEVKGNKISFFSNGNLTVTATMRLQAEGESRLIDLSISDGGEASTTLEGIYALKQDELKLCVNLKEKDRPTEFVSKPDSPTVLVVFKRDKT